MKKQRKIELSWLLSILLIFLWFVPTHVYADSDEIHSIDMEVTLQEDGSATIESVWHLSQYNGTEFYIPMGNTEVSKVTEFTVSEDGIVFDDLGEDWDTDRSLEAKKHTNGIYLNDGQQELSWGIGSYGEHEYHLKYSISNFVRKTSDNKYLLFWKFLNDSMNIPVKKMSVTIQADTPMDKEDLRIWGFGFYGNTEIRNDGTLYAESNGAIDYFTLLAFVPENIFNEQVISIDDSSEAIVEMAKEGSDYGSFNEEDDISWWLVLIIMVIMITIPLIIFLSVKGDEKYKSKLKKKTLEGKYWRDIPFNGDYHLMDMPIKGLKLGDDDSVMTAYFLKWIMNDSLTVVDGRKKNQKSLQIHPENFNRLNISESSFESKLFQMVEKASVDGILEAKEFTKWAKKNYKELENWQDDVYNDSHSYLVNNKYYYYERKGRLFKTSQLTQTEKGDTLEKHLVMFRNYLLEFSLLNERGSVDVHLWDELLIWAALLGIADEVFEEFNKLYPRYSVETQVTPEAIYWSNYYSHRAIMSANHAASEAKASSGFGGGTNFGGGGGSFGGGSGGGYR